VLQRLLLPVGGLLRRATNFSAQEERDKFRRWIELGEELRELRLDKVHKEIEIEEVEEEIHAMPAVCKVEEERLHKLELIKTRNELKVALEDKFYSGEMDESMLEWMEIELSLLQSYVPARRGERREAGEGGRADRKGERSEVVEARRSKRLEGIDAREATRAKQSEASNMSEARRAKRGE
jgi:hypothetical protein